MARHNGKPSNANDEQGTGIPSKLQPEDRERSEEMTRKYTDDDREIADGIRTNNVNRNTDKGEATNDGGYKN